MRTLVTAAIITFLGVFAVAKAPNLLTEQSHKMEVVKSIEKRNAILATL